MYRTSLPISARNSPRTGWHRALHPKRLWEPLVVDAVTNAMRDAVRSRADEWALRDVALR